MTNIQNTPAEALERSFPMRVLRYRLRHGSGGAGYSRGGEGIERDLQVLDDCTVSLITIHLRAGDVLRMLTPGGGGWGPAETP